MLERGLAKEEIGRLLVAADLTESDGASTANILFISLFIRKFPYKQNRSLLCMPLVHKQ
jgi:hypothetical protein